MTDTPERAERIAQDHDEAIRIEQRDAMAQKMMSALQGYPVDRRDVWTGMWNVADAVLAEIARVRDEAIVKYGGQAERAERERNVALDRLEAAREQIHALTAERDDARAVAQAARDEMGSWRKDEVFALLDSARAERDRAYGRLREIARVGDTLSPQELCNHAALGQGLPMYDYPGDPAIRHKSVIELNNALMAMRRRTPFAAWNSALAEWGEGPRTMKATADWANRWVHVLRQDSERMEIIESALAAERDALTAELADLRAAGAVVLVDGSAMKDGWDDLLARAERAEEALKAVQHNRSCSCYAHGGPCARCLAGYDEVDAAIRALPAGRE